MKSDISDYRLLHELIIEALNNPNDNTFFSDSSESDRSKHIEAAISTLFAIENLKKIEQIDEILEDLDNGSISDYEVDIILKSNKISTLDIYLSLLKKLRKFISGGEFYTLSLLSPKEETLDDFSSFLDKLNVDYFSI